RYPAAMLKARAISEVARDACQEVLLGIAYTPAELGADDDGGEIIHDGWPTRDGIVDPSQMTEGEKDAAGLMTRSQRVQHDALRRMGEPPAGAVQIIREPDPEDPWAGPEPPDVVTPAQLKKLGVIFSGFGFGSAERAQRLDVVSRVIRREVGSMNELTKEEASKLIDTLEQFADRGALIEAMASEADGA
ncbi:MAG TPA: hypothetical protein VGP87_13445, partial [Gemmatimonadales bacterium]|nr:hypothetical protein [Gemmatimonadales bacterium]